MSHHQKGHSIDRRRRTVDVLPPCRQWHVRHWLNDPPPPNPAQLEETTTRIIRDKMLKASIEEFIATPQTLMRLHVGRQRRREVVVARPNASELRSGETRGREGKCAGKQTAARLNAPTVESRDGERGSGRGITKMMLL